MTVTETKNRPMKGTAEKTSVAEEEHDDMLTLNLPMVSLQVHQPHMHLPHMDKGQAGHAMRRAAKSTSAQQVVYYGGLGALAAVGVIEWPIAAAIGVGTLIAARAKGAAKTDRSAAKQAPPARERTPQAAEPKEAPRRTRRQA
ncbi:hypothetical protein [Herbidospora sp. NBRC 101105]|uniref:hypothetical protein n=1 Tax=Herbidospora sp. NBRC 101105 TaxID=3032195 RepID=UPI0024A53622|nr:hypothetical protein [Herbidospora sp. NBRC 101105]GLX99377.1 hypothetical protein Hesp01_73270 [Herbidospora sp. NBRC 101105]